MKPKTGLITIPIPTCDGTFVAQYSARGLAGLEFPPARIPHEQPGVIASESSAQIRRWHTATTKALEQALAGQTPRILPPLDFSSGTPFQQRVWAALRKIAHGKTQSYGQVAAAIGKPKSVRAVGGACGANLIPVLIPCHRVLAANGGLGGFSSPMKWKRTLLAREGIRLAK